MNKNILRAILLFALAFVVGCEDDDDPFVGDDNFITSFSLKQGEISYDASFKGDTIILETPEGIVLNDVTASVVCSENSSIKPHPSVITNWDEQIYFVVTSYSGAERRYLYIPEKKALAFEGIVILNTQEDVDAFGAKGLTRIDGSLIIGRQNGTDTIHSLEALSSLKSVANDVTINRLFMGYELTGLDNLEEIGGNFMINYVDSLWGMTFNHLVRVGGDLNIGSNAISEILCPRLESVGGTITLAAAFVTSDFSSLRQISGGLNLNGKTGMTGIVFQSLERVGGAIASTMTSLKKLEFPVLRNCDKLTVGKGALGLLYMPLLEDVATELVVENNPLYEVSFPVLSHAGMITLNCPNVNQFNAPFLKTVDNNFSLTLAGVNPEQFSVLESVGGVLSLNFAAEDFKLPSNLKKLGILVISAGITRLDIRGTEINELQFNGVGLENTTVIGDDVFAGGFNLQNLGGYFPKLEGFHEIGGLTIGYLGMGGNTVEIAGIRKINGNFSYWANSNVDGILLTDLEEVGGNFRLFSNIKKYHFPKLEHIGGNAMMSIDNYDDQTFPLLTTVGGDLVFKTGYQDRWGGSYGPQEILYPSLRSVEGVLDIRPATPSPWNENPSEVNKKLDNLDFLAGLESIGGFRLVNHEVMISYEGLKKAISTCPASKWQVENNGYNPTYEELTEKQQWTKPE